MFMFVLGGEVWSVFVCFEKMSGDEVLFGTISFGSGFVAS